jgi:hypothetical protein
MTMVAESTMVAWMVISALSGMAIGIATNFIIYK